VKDTERLLLGNKSWAQERRSDDPQFFERLAREQRPEFLWIGCSDSRVPANQVTNTDAGEIFVHRNIANVVRPNDVNIGSVLQYAIDVLLVKHVIVCGHYGCGGVRASMSTLPGGAVGEWLQGVHGIYHSHRGELEKLPEDQRADALCELNVRAQVKTLSELPVVQAAWKARGRPYLHGWVYGLRDGILRELVTLTP
jgi:carbonic anhydrase